MFFLFFIIFKSLKNHFQVNREGGGHRDGPPTSPLPPQPKIGPPSSSLVTTAG
jgi:hypothetical protein